MPILRPSIAGGLEDAVALIGDERAAAGDAVEHLLARQFLVLEQESDESQRPLLNTSVVLTRIVQNQV